MKINIEKNLYDVNIDDLIVMAKRANNIKRNFLFVSKVLGKHIEVKPNVCKSIGVVLASLLCADKNAVEKNIEALKNKNNDIIYENYDYEKSLVLGFAETATGIGMAVASAIKGCKYLTTTRENISDVNSIINFEEEHSHATTHKCFVDDHSFMKDIKTIILVDDEITTGKSMLNIIKELKRVTGIKKYKILSILDWRNKEYLNDYDKFENENEVQVQVLSLISGNIENSNFDVFTGDDETQITQEIECIKAFDILKTVSHECDGSKISYIKDTGRFGTSFEEILNLENSCEKIARKIENYVSDKDKVLVLGHGENIYIPSRIASYINADVYFKSTTRSPIYCENLNGYQIREKHYFYDRGTKYYFYNKSDIEKEYDKVILLTETNLPYKLCENMISFSLVGVK